MVLNNVRIGDKFKHGKHTVCEVVDFHKVTSWVNNDIIRWECVVKGVGTLAKNTFTVPFSTVARNRINHNAETPTP